jgi:D-galactose 1-dehydrogenase
VRSGRSDVDLSPLRLTADAFMLGRRIDVEPFYDNEEEIAELEGTL